MTKRLSITLTDEQHELLRLVALQSHRSVSNLVASMVNDLAPVLQQLIRSKTAREASAYIDKVVAEQEARVREAQAQLWDLDEPPSSNTGVRK